MLLKIYIKIRGYIEDWDLFPEILASLFESKDSKGFERRTSKRTKAQIDELERFIELSNYNPEVIQGALAKHPSVYCGVVYEAWEELNAMVVDRLNGRLLGCEIENLDTPEPKTMIIQIRIPYEQYLERKYRLLNLERGVE